MNFAISRKALLSLILMLLLSPISLAEIYRCETNDGNIRFSDRPCQTRQKSAIYKPQNQLLGLWHYDLNTALQTAKREKKHLLIAFDAKWCRWCKKMQAVTYQDQAVLKTLNKYVPVIIDVDDSPELANDYKANAGKYGGKGVPATIIIDTNRQELYRHHGYMDPDWMLDILSKSS